MEKTKMRIFEMRQKFIMQHGRYRTDLEFRVNKAQNRIYLLNVQNYLYVAKGMKDIERYLENHDMVLVDK